MLNPPRQERIEDLALLLRKWCSEHEPRMVEAAEDFAMAVLVANQGNAPHTIAHEISKQLMRLAIAQSQGKTTGEIRDITAMTKNVNDILRGRA